MQYKTHLLIVSLAVAFCRCDTTNAFTTNFVSPTVDVPQRQRQKQQLQRVRPDATTLNHHSIINQNVLNVEGRRDFLKQLSTAITGTSLTPLLLPQSAVADDDENEDDATTIDKVETILKDESELDSEVLQEEEDEKKSIEDEKQLINELEKEISIEESDTSTPEEIEEEASKVRGETEVLIEEEEKLLNEAEDIISKIESIESEVQSLDEAEKSNSGGDDTSTTSETFVDKLKERVERKEDLITRLKRQSENDIDPKTGKFRPLTAGEYKERVKNTDVDFLQFLKDTVANEKEWEQDLNAFDGFLDKEFGPAVRELKKDLTPLVREAKKDLKPLVDEAETGLRQEVAPAVEDALKQLKEKAGKAADDEVEDLKLRAGDLIGKLKGIF